MTIIKNALAKIQSFLKPTNPKGTPRDMQKAGTGFMPSVSEILVKLEARGYRANLVARFDHFEINSGAHKLYPQDFIVEQIFRNENTSDPDDQSIIYAIASATQNIKGVYIESYGPQTEPLSPEMLARLQTHSAAHS